MIDHMDDFEIYGRNKAFLTNGVFAEATATGTDLELVADPDGISTGTAAFFHVATTNTPTLRYVYSTAQDIAGWAGRVWMSILPDGNNKRPDVISFRDAGNSQYLSLRIETTGRMTIYGDGGTHTSPNPVISANGWYHVEVKYDTTGAGNIEVRIEGTTIINEALGYAGHGQVYQISTYYTGTNLSGPDMYIKDYVVWNGSGTENNDFLGSVLVADLRTIADIALNWTPSTGANGYSILDNAPPVDTVFLTAPNPPPAAYVASMSDLPPEITSVKAIMTFVRAAKTDGGDASLQVGVISDGVTGLGANRPITVAQTYWRDVFETDPATTDAWLPAAVNAAYMQMNRTV
jgi:hypothetical protein